MTYAEWKNLPAKIEVECPPDCVGHCPYPDYLDATCLDDVMRGKRVYLKGLYSGSDYEQTVRPL